MAASAAAVQVLPKSFGDWNIVAEQELDAEIAALLRPAASLLRTYSNTSTGQRVNVALLVGLPGPLSIHRPEICYSSQDFEIEERRERLALAAGDKTVRLWGVTFRSAGLQAATLRVVYGWRSAIGWQAPRSPRHELRGEPYLIKVQASALLPPATNTDKEDPCQDFLANFLPLLDSKTPQRMTDSVTTPT